jgi:hypothetical protein
MQRKSASFPRGGNGAVHYHDPPRTMIRGDLANLAALAAIQVSNALLPLFVFPYALSVVGAGPYATLAMTEAVMIAALSVVLYSFEVDGVARVVKLDWRRDKEALSHIYSTVFWARLGLFGACMTAAILARPFMDSTTSDLLLAWLAVPLSYALQANWLFQAAERNVFVALATVVSRVGAALLVLSCVDTPEDVVRIPIVLGACYLAASLASFWYARKELGARVLLPPVDDIVRSMRHGWHVFVGSLAVIMYRDFNVVILGAMQADAKAVAAYSLAEKLVKGLQATMRPLNQIYFPKTLRKLGEGRQADRQSLFEIIAYLYPQLMALTAVIVISGMAYLAGLQHFEAIGRSSEFGQIPTLTAIMLPATYFGLANFMLGTAGLNHLDERVYLYRAILLVGLISIASCAALSYSLGAEGAALGFALAELLLLLIILTRYYWRPIRNH